MHQLSSGVGYAPLGSGLVKQVSVLDSLDTIVDSVIDSLNSVRVGRALNGVSSGKAGHVFLD